MNVTVKMFAGAREIVGKEEITVDLPPGATVGHLRDVLIQDHAELRHLLPHAMFAINATYCDNSTQVPESADIACIPPVSGG